MGSITIHARTSPSATVFQQRSWSPRVYRKEDVLNCRLL